MPESSRDLELDRSFGFVVGRYLCGRRGKELLAGVPAAWKDHVRWFEVTRLVAALSSRSRADRATALARELASLIRELDARELG